MLPTPTLASTHSLTTFAEAMRSMRDDAFMMASLAERNLENSRQGLFGRDEDACNTAIADDEEIDTLEVQIDQNGMALMLRFHPVASDLRNVMATMKLSANLERVADQSVNIARRAKRLHARPALPETAALQPIFTISALMLKDAIRGFADSDLDLARSLKLRDKELDRLNREYADLLTERMAENVSAIPSYMDLIFIARFLERIGDQAKNIGEDTIFAVTAEETRHTNKRP